MATWTKVAFFLIVIGFLEATVGCLLIGNVHAYNAPRALAISGFVFVSVAVGLLTLLYILEEIQGLAGLILKIVACATAGLGGVLYLASAASALEKYEDSYRTSSSSKLQGFPATIAIIGSLLVIGGAVFIVVDIIVGARSGTGAGPNPPTHNKPDM